jgi:Glycosyltransferase like family 2
MSPTGSTAVVGLGVDRDLVTAAAGAAEGSAEVIWPLETDHGALHSAYRDARWRATIVVASDLGSLRLALPVLASLGTTARLSVTVVDHDPSGGEPSRWPGSVVLDGVSTVATERREGGGSRVDLAFARPVPVHRAVAELAGERARHPAGGPSGGLRLAAADPWSLRWCVGEPSARTIENADLDWQGDETRGLPCDAEIRSAAARGSLADATTSAPLVASRSVDVTGRCPPADIAVLNPRGFNADPRGAVGHVVVTTPPTGPDVRVAADGRDVARWGPGVWLGPSALAALRPLAYVDASAVHHADPAVTATVLTQLAIAGVPVLTGPLPSRARPLLHPDLAESLEAATTTELADDLGREVRAVRSRRAAMRRHSPGATIARLRVELGLSPSPDRTVSVVVVTRRPAQLRHVFFSIGRQEQVNAELVLVTHGFEPTVSELDRLRDGVAAEVVVRTAPESLVLGEALNIATECASGDLLAKMDDDDWYGPHHLEDLVQALSWSGATLVGVMQEFAYLADVDVTTRRNVGFSRERAAQHVPGPTMMIRRDDVLSLGGWRPTSIAEDLSLSHAVRESGGGLHETHGLGFVLCRHGQGHSWKVSSERFLAAASTQWPGFHPPPELGDVEEATDYYRSIRSAREFARSGPGEEQPRVGEQGGDISEES